MKQSDTKRALVSAFVVGAFSTLCVETCNENQFRLEESLCCSYCSNGMYVAMNCSRQNGIYVGVSCKQCSSCEKTGQRTSNCTAFQDTLCAISVDLPEGKLPQITLFGVIASVLILVVLVAVYSCCKITKSDERSAGEPFQKLDAQPV